MTRSKKILQLKKETLSELGTDELARVVGGGPTDVCTNTCTGTITYTLTSNASEDCSVIDGSAVSCNSCVTC
jgi:hypothetical protein